ncbi:MAG: type 4a pilus biogenesis protein PilO [bacterium]|nr:type 4a pilus biogenesis protein PilO [bacterium]
MTNQRDQLVTGILTVGLTAAFAAAIYVPHQHKMQRLRNQSQSMRDELGRRTARVAGLQDLGRELLEVEQSVADFDESVPTGGRLGTFIERVTEVASAQGLVDPEFKPLSPERSRAVSALPLQITCSAPFESVYGFVEAVETMPRLARVSQVSLALAEDRPGWLQMELTVQIFHQNRVRDQGFGG